MKNMIKSLVIVSLLATGSAFAEGRNDRVYHDRTILKNGLLLSLKKNGKQIPVKINAGTIGRDSASVAVKKVSKGYNFKLILTSTTLKARWVDSEGQARRVSLLFNGKGHH